MPALIASVRAAKSQEQPALRFQTAREMFQEMAEDTPYVLAPYLIEGAKTKMDAPPKFGKTTFRNYLIRCLLNGEPCLGYPAPARRMTQA